MRAASLCPILRVISLILANGWGPIVGMGVTLLRPPSGALAMKASTDLAPVLAPVLAVVVRLTVISSHLQQL
jgi:hypothetical protein